MKPRIWNRNYHQLCKRDKVLFWWLIAVGSIMSMLMVIWQLQS